MTVAFVIIFSNQRKISSIFFSRQHVVNKDFVVVGLCYKYYLSLYEVCIFVFSRRYVLISRSALPVCV